MRNWPPLEDPPPQSIHGADSLSGREGGRAVYNDGTKSKIGVKKKKPLHPIHSRAEMMKYPRAFRIQDAVGIVEMIVYL